MARAQTLEGRLVDERGRPHEGLRVEGKHRRLLGPDVDLGAARTGEDGRFVVPFTPDAYQLLLPVPPDVRVHVLDARGLRLLGETGPVQRTGDQTFHAGDIVVPRREAGGWIVTMGRDDAPRLTTGNALRMLPDHATMDTAMDAMENARERVTMLQLLFKTGFVPTFPSDATPRLTSGETLVSRIKRIARRGVEFRIVLNENFAIPDDVDELKQAFSDTPGVEVRGFPITPGVMHAKTILVDDEVAYLLGQPFQQRFWDTRAHQVDEPRRGEPQPLHDVSLEVRGPAARDVGILFAELWNLRREGLRTDDPPESAPRKPAPAGGDVLQVVRTAPQGLAQPEGERGILESYQRALGNAQRFFYAENQYFTSGTFARALRRALDAAPELEAILLLNVHTDVLTYDQWQALRLWSVGHPDQPQLGVFSLWSRGVDRDGRHGLKPVYVHSKVAFADDAWASIGSANLDGICLDGASEFGFPTDRSIEMNVLLFEGVEGFPATGRVAQLRADLWSEHLGLSAARLQREPRGGWLAFWREAAARNLQAVEEGRIEDVVGRVLPFDAHVPEALRLPV